MSGSSNPNVALVPVDSDWRPIFHDSNQVVLYNPTSHALAIKPRPPCPYCKQPLPLGFEFESHFVHDNYEDNASRASNYFHLLAIANENGNSVPSTRAPSPTSSSGRIVDSAVVEEVLDEAPNNSSNGRTMFPTGTLAEGYFNAFFREECKLGMGANGSVFLCQHMLDGNALGHFAVKKIAVGDSHSYLLKTLREVRLLERLHHPNIITYHHSWLESCQFSSFGPRIPTLHVLMQWAEGGSLDDYIDVRLGKEPRHGQFIPNPYQSEHIEPLDTLPSTRLSNASFSSLSGSSSSPLAPKPTSHINSIDDDTPEVDPQSRSARIRAFRAFQRAPPEEKERIRREMQSQSTGQQQTTWTPVHLLSAEEVHSLFKDVVEGLAFLHDRSILHLDLKPGNVLLTWDDEQGKMIPRAMLSDFGTSRDMLVSSLNNRSGNTGTLEYTAPESLPSPHTGTLREIDSKADMWSLGMILHRMLFFKLPWRYTSDGVGEDPTTPMVSGLPEPMGDAKAKSPKMRRPPARNEAEKIERLEQEVLSYSGFRSTPVLAQAFEARKLPRAMLVLLENLLNPIPAKRPTCERVKGAVRDGKLDPISDSYRDYNSSLTRNVYNVRTTQSDINAESSAVVNAATHPAPSSMTSLVPISRARARSHTSPAPPSSQPSSMAKIVRQDGLDDSVSRGPGGDENGSIIDEDSGEDVDYHDAREKTESEGELGQVAADTSHSRKTLLALPSPVPEPPEGWSTLDITRLVPVEMRARLLVTTDMAGIRTVKSLVLVIKIFNLTTMCPCSNQGNLGVSLSGGSLTITIVVVLLAVADTWFDGLWTSVIFGLAHVVMVKIGCYVMECLC